mgnify:CR=1 FL=1
MLHSPTRQSSHKVTKCPQHPSSPAASIIASACSFGWPPICRCSKYQLFPPLFVGRVGHACPPDVLTMPSSPKFRIAPNTIGIQCQSSKQLRTVCRGCARTNVKSAPQIRRSVSNTAPASFCSYRNHGNKTTNSIR